MLLAIGQKSLGQILHTDLVPDILASDLPLGTTDSVFLDVNLDGHNDFILFSYSWYEQVHQTCCWCRKNKIVGLER